MVSKGNERWHRLGRGDSDGKHLPVKPVIVSVRNSEVESVRNWLIAGLKYGGVTVSQSTICVRESC